VNITLITNNVKVKLMWNICYLWFYS